MNHKSLKHGEAGLMRDLFSGSVAAALVLAPAFSVFAQYPAQPYPTPQSAPYAESAPHPSYIPQATQDVGYAEGFQGAASVGNNEQLYRFDDQERWKHGYMQKIPYYEGYKAFRPYNYHHVFSQSQTAAGWGMPATMPYSQQFWHRYENMTDLSRGDHTPVAPYVPPPKQFEHYPKPLGPGAFITPPSPEQLQSPGAPERLPIELPPAHRSQPVEVQAARPAIQPTSNWSGYQLQAAPRLVAPY
ncbi:MAG TPA: hypothetical protein VNQ76_00965 [Planctomicrobium sp.]|nr:hypothetical protein [Planctomicrobium sp.]